jgi:ABC-type transport system substrate-binding protein
MGSAQAFGSAITEDRFAINAGNSVANLYIPLFNFMVGGVKEKLKLNTPLDPLKGTYTFYLRKGVKNQLLRLQVGMIDWKKESRKTE